MASEKFSVKATILLLFVAATSVSMGSIFYRLSGLPGTQVSMTPIQMVPLSLLIYSLNPKILSEDEEDENDENNQNDEEAENSRSKRPSCKFMAFLNGLILRALDDLAFYQALNYVSAGEVLLISSFTSLVTSVIGEYLLYKRKPPILTVVSMVLGITGVTLLARPEIFFGTEPNSASRQVFGIFWAVVTGSSSAIYFFGVRRIDGVSVYWHFFPNSIGCAALSLVYFGYRFSFNLSSCSVWSRIFAVLSGFSLSVNATISLSNVFLGQILPSIVYISRFWAIFLSFTLEMVYMPSDISLQKIAGCAIVILALLAQMNVMTNRRN